MATTTETEAITVSETVGKPKGFQWKKFKILIGIIIIIVIGLAVGLGVGLTRGKGGDDDDNDSDNNNKNKDSDSDNNNTDDDSSSPPDFSNLWQPKVGTSWQIVLRQPIIIDTDDASSIEPDVAIYDLDLYDNDVETFSALQAEGKRIICYFSAGSWEDWRDDKDDFDEDDLGKELDGWEDEKWLKLSSKSVRDIMKKRIKVAADKGCDAIDPDNVDGYQNDNGLGLTAAHSISFMKFLSTEAAKYNMSTGLKNAGDIIDDVLDYVAFSVNEQCIEYSECETFAAFIDDDKPVFNIEYPDGAPKVREKDRKTICSHEGKAKGTEGFSTVIKKMDLDGWVMYCPDDTYETPIDS